MVPDPVVLILPHSILDIDYLDVFSVMMYFFLYFYFWKKHFFFYFGFEKVKHWLYLYAYYREGNHNRNNQVNDN